MLNNKLKVIYSRGKFLGQFVIRSLLCISKDFYLASNTQLYSPDLLYLISNKEITYMIGSEPLKKYNLKGNINENKAITEHT